MNKLDKIGRITNIVLGVLYVPVSLFSWLSQMASEGTMDATNPLYMNLIEIFCIVAFIIPLLCILGIVLSVVFRKKGHCVLSFIIQFIPLGIFGLNLILLAFAESLPPVL